MVEYYLRYDKKNIKSNINKLIIELQTFFNFYRINIEETNDIFFEELEGIISKTDFKTINNLYFSIYKNKESYPFLKKYIKPKDVNNDRKYRFADLFSGCGGLSLGLENAGFNCQFVNEIDSTFCETFYFNHNLPLDNYYIGDINELVKNIEDYRNKISDLDLVCGGPPCQGFSMANRQRIIDDPRNNLYKAYLEFLRFTKPKFFVMENVKGMSKKIDEILSDFKEYLNDDYDIHYSLFNVKDFGLPQNRERFFIIGNRIGVKSETIFRDIENSKSNTQFVLKDALSNLPILNPKSIKNNNEIENIETGFTIAQQKLDSNKFLDFINGNEKVEFVFNHKNRFNNERDIEIFRRLPQGANSLHESIKDIMPYASRNHMFKDKYFKLDETQPCKTITSHMKFDCNMYIHPTQSRGLSSREAARVQTFPDNFFIRGSQNIWYAQIGNAVPVKFSEIIGKQIIKHL
jgi:DNA (cytosine-5)-methyltransferase 1